MDSVTGVTARLRRRGRLLAGVATLALTALLPMEGYAQSGTQSPSVIVNTNVLDSLGPSTTGPGTEPSVPASQIPQPAAAARQGTGSCRRH